MEARDESAGGSFTSVGRSFEDDGYAALYSIYPPDPGLRLLPPALLLAVTGAPPRAGRLSITLDALGTRNTGVPSASQARVGVCDAATVRVQADHGEWSARGNVFGQSSDGLDVRAPDAPETHAS